jgi:predicted double-glycine peptidase
MPRKAEATTAKHGEIGPSTARAVLVLCALFAVRGAAAGSIWLPDVADGSANVPTTSVAERKFKEIVRQQFDFSCGSAALATLLTYHYSRPTDEMTAFRYMYEKGDQQKIAQAGFSLLDMKGYLGSLGLDADGYQAELETLANAGIPAIALINYRGYRHFVVVKGVRRDSVLLGDPALGTRLVSRDEFEASWENNVLFIVKSEADVGRNFFNTEQQWQHLAAAPLGTAIGADDLATLTVNLPRLGEF